jgi:hypothetical protein
MHDIILGILPAPTDVHYNIIEDPPGYLQILWAPPTLDSDELDLQNASIKRDARIIRYTIYITTEESTIVQVYNASGTSFIIGIDKIPCSFWFQVAVVNPAGMGERSVLQNLNFDSEFASDNIAKYSAPDHNNNASKIVYSTVYASTYRVHRFHN